MNGCVVEFPDFVKNLPQADLPFQGLNGWLVQSPSGQVLFNESAIELEVPEHAHGEQWGVVIDGSIDLTIDGATRTYRSGDSYFIPSGAPHRATIHPGFRAIDFFSDQHRYRLRAG
jgi:hypothetical protein